MWKSSCAAGVFLFATCTHMYTATVWLLCCRTVSKTVSMLCVCLHGHQFLYCSAPESLVPTFCKTLQHYIASHSNRLDIYNKPENTCIHAFQLLTVCYIKKQTHITGAMYSCIVDILNVTTIFIQCYPAIHDHDILVHCLSTNVNLANFRLLVYCFTPELVSNLSCLLSYLQRCFYFIIYSNCSAQICAMSCAL